jgi:hypothetical protein
MEFGQDLARTAVRRAKRVLHLIAALIAAIPAAAGAQVAVVEQVVDVRMATVGDSLVVELDVPASVIAAANTSGPPGSTPSVTAPLQDLALVARALGYELDVWQGGEPLPVGSADGRVGNGSRVDFRLAYGLGPGDRDISARLNTFVGPMVSPITTRVTYLLSNGEEQTLTLRGAPTRVRFDPGPFDALRDFLVRALNALLSGGDHLLFLACILLPGLRVREAATLFGWAAAGQAVAMAISLFVPLPDAVVLPLRMIGTSAVVIAGIQAVVGARFRWMLPVALVFGLGNGFAFGSTFAAAEPFAGTQVAIAALTFIAAVLVGQLWLGAVAWLGRDWLGTVGAFPRFVLLLAAVVLIHSALHRIVDVGRQLAGSAGEPSSTALWLALGWVVACVLVGFLNGSRPQPPTGAFAAANEGES